MELLWTRKVGRAALGIRCDVGQYHLPTVFQPVRRVRVAGQAEVKTEALTASVVGDRLDNGVRHHAQGEGREGHRQGRGPGFGQADR